MKFQQCTEKSSFLLCLLSAAAAVELHCDKFEKKASKLNNFK